MSTFITDEQEEEVMEDRYKIEVGDIIQVTDETCESTFYSYGDIARVVEVKENDTVLADFRISECFRLDVPFGKAIWCVSRIFITKINVVKEGV